MTGAMTPAARIDTAMNQTHWLAPGGATVAICRVTYRMTDQMGMVYYGNYMELFEIGRVELLRATGISYKQMESEGFLLPVIHASCDYHLAARYDDLLEIATRIQKVSRAKIQFAYEIRRRGEDDLLAEGTTRHAYLSPEGKLRRMSRDWFEILDRVSKLGSDGQAARGNSQG